MWIVLVDLAIVPVWVPLVFIIRGTIVDTIRANQVSTSGDSPFSMLQYPVGKWIVAGKFMRGFYAAVKATTFCWLLLVRALIALWPNFFAGWVTAFEIIGSLLVYLSVLTCIVRGLPVVWEFVYQERESLAPGIARSRRSRS
jgi:CDP-diacylglycerol--glycerol-3-phosphate 3-phosphatidyltransferase